VIAPARIAAYEIGMAIAAGADLPAALAEARPTLADDRDRALAAEIATGVERWRAQLDQVIAHFAKRALDRIDPEVVAILRIGLYQILHLTRVPVSAAVDDAVQMAKRMKKRSAAGFINAVLRTAARKRQALPLPARPANPAERAAALDYFSVTLSHPRWLAGRWYDRFGFETAEKWLTFDNQHAPLTLRVNRLRATREGIIDRLAHEDVTVDSGRFAPDALTVIGGNPLRTAAFAEGLFLVQNESSQLVTLLAGSHPGPRVLDTCASPGGKAVALASLDPAMRIVACDVRAPRIELLQRTVRTVGATNVFIVRADARHPLPFSAQFDCVMVDAPCSGLGTLRRDPDIRWRRKESDLAVFASAQADMLARAADAVRPGGRLIYATCSSEPEENEQVVDAFLSRWPAFRSVDARIADARLADVVDTRGHLRTTPDRHRLEAFFGAVFEKQLR
jgi:16S rRNA (cytosine967-C5)-methyltransferase